jgi:hypothetical protein
VSGQFTPRPLYPQGKNHRYPLDRRLGGPQSRSGRGGEAKDSQPLPRIEPRSSSGFFNLTEIKRVTRVTEMWMRLGSDGHEEAEQDTLSTLISLSILAVVPTPRTETQTALNKRSKHTELCLAPQGKVQNTVQV